MLLILPFYGFYKNIKAQVQTPIPCPAGSPCHVCYPLTRGAIALDGSPSQCDLNGISYAISARLQQSYLGGSINIIRTGYSITHGNYYGWAIQTFSDNQEVELWRNCGGLPPGGQNCPAGDSRQISTSSQTSVNSSDYPSGYVHFEASTNIEVRDDRDPNYIQCEIGTIYVSGDVCTIGSVIPPSGCAPQPTPVCGANNQCLPTQICGVNGQCIVASYCHCNVNMNPSQCGGGGCPPTHYCYHDVVSGQGICREDPDNCHACNDPPGQCGGDCNLLQRCVGGFCVFDIIYCVNPTPDPQSTPMPQARCDPVGQPPDSGVDTAIGCIPVITATTQPFITFMLRWAFGISGGLAFLLILYAGYQIITSAGNPKKIAAGKELLTAAIAGLLLLIFSVYVLETIGVDILRLPGL